MVIQERHFWLNLEEMRDADKVRFLDAPIVFTQGPGAQKPQPTGDSGQMGKEQALPGAEHLFSRDIIGLSHNDGTPYDRACLVCADLGEWRLLPTWSS